MSPETNYNKTGETLFDEDSLKKLACYGMEFAKKKMAQNTAVAPAIAGRSKALEKYLAYIVFGRIVRLSAAARQSGVLHADSVKLMEEMGKSINEKVAKNGTNELKGTDFTDPKMIGVLGKGFDTVEVDDLFTQLSGSDIDVVRRLGSVIVAENPKPDPKSSTFVLD